MIKKDKNVWGHSSFVVTDKRGNTFEIFEGGNLDLFWVCDCKESERRFVIDESNKEMFRLLKVVFKNIKENDSKHSPRLVGNEFTWISEDRPESNILKIIKNENNFEINFIKNENNFYKMCAICFCNSGSNFQKIERLFMEMYIYLCQKESVDTVTK